MKTFAWLVKREYWERRGGMLWAQVVSGGVMLLVSLVGLLIGEVALRAHGGMDTQIQVGVPLGQLINHPTAAQIAQFGHALDASMISFVGIGSMVLAFVLFFYLLSALYDERKDRSILFWKSLPVSDRDTVLSKVVTATVLAPVIAMIVALAAYFAVLILLSLFALLHGGNPVTLLWLPSHPLLMLVKLVIALPLNALWALPTVGWLLLCSSAVRAAPFLWAVLLPLAAGVLNGVVRLMGLPSIPGAMMWNMGVLRMLGGTFPGWFAHLMATQPRDFDPLRDGVLGFDLLGRGYAMPSLWIGALIGSVMIAVAIAFRRRNSDL
ncbi:MAG: ABC-2 transporter permease [Xanthomonadaceae bacterium]|nr:ABC-2 transporter permease [Xanthomonadaceae bacterium]MDE1958875.1 ABC-2 transporter permease [Xanthomonadaceae bacterium]MDE2178592.1 ABC-2 transporter permease [Xanthomonadaceae bacterium]MDE2246146.1 ABC-2 transporter permease [Xanthomonadaceae bacterium]